MPEPLTLDDLLDELSTATHELSVAIAELQIRLGKDISEAEKQTIRLALPSLKTRLRAAEARYDALAAKQVEFEAPTDQEFEDLEKAADQLSAATARGDTGAAIVQAAT